MGLFRRSAAGVKVTLYEGKVPLEVVGESSYQDDLAKAVSELGREVPAILLPEPDNEYDGNAVSEWIIQV